MRILFTHTPPDLYGASRCLLRLTTRLVQDGNAVCVILGADGPLRPALELAGVTVRVCPQLAFIDKRKYAAFSGWLKLGFSFVASLIQIRRITGTFRPDVLHTNTSVILTPGVVAKLCGIPHVWHVREVYAGFTGLWKRYQWFVLFFSSRVICVSREVAEQFTLSRTRQKLCIVHDGLPAAEFPEITASRVKDFRARYKLDGNPLIGLVGRIKIGRKGQDVFLKAAAGIKSRFPNARFMLIGSPFPGNEGHLDIVQNLIQELRLSNEVIYAGEVDDIGTAYAALDISVQASVLPEAFSGVVIESMAMGKAVVASNFRSTNEQIDHGDNGILVAPGDTSQLESALGALLEDETLRQELGGNARKKFLEKFEFEKFYKKMCAVYSSVLQTAGGPDEDIYRAVERG
jgi:glycosyltransferase involved in cell wall biosynthesis